MRPADHLRRYASLLAKDLSEDLLGRRDPEFIRGELELLGPALDAWFAPVVDGLENLPDGRALVVGTHNGGVVAPDMFCTMVAFWRRFGVERLAYGLAHDRGFDVPMIGRWIARLGAVPARPGIAGRLLDRDAAVLVYPGGDLDAFKPFHARHRVTFGGRIGFVRTALRARAPIVPVVSVGAHETVYVIADGSALARRSGWKRLTRIEVLPLMLCLPWGLIVGPYELHIPAPSKVRVRILPPIATGLPPEAADDERAVARVRDRVCAAMQAGIDALVAEGHYGVRERLSELAMGVD